ncbi:MAG: ParA family protein [Promethearchaeota archaeon]|nr:MAG: ParA family protein [Candidatus Lokiarchaeota archaeon]
MKSIAFLSHKGGIGKTCLSLNTAVYLALQGKNVCLVDHDFFGPSLSTFVKPNVDWINEYIMGDKKPEDVLQDQSDAWNLPGKLILGFANPMAEAVQHIIRIDQKTSMRMLQNMLKLKKVLEADPYNIDYFILDSSPGTGFTTVNAMLISTVNIFCVKVGNADINGTSEMIAGLTRHLENKVLVLANQVPASSLDTDEKQRKLGELIIKKFKEKIPNETTYIGAIPTDIDMQLVEFETAYETLQGFPPKRIVHILEKPEHIFSKALIKYLPKILEEIG